MQRRRVRWVWLVPGTAALALGLLARRPSGAQAPVPVGGQFQVNTYTSNGQTVSSVAMEPDGDFVVAWANFPSFGPNIKGQRYASTGSARGGEFQINSSGTNLPNRTSVAADADGDFVVVWSYFLGDHVMGQRFASNGSPRGAQFQINTYTTWGHSGAFVAAASDGDFVVAWTQESPNREIYGKRYASSGSQQGSFGTDTSNTSIQGQRFSVPSFVPALSRTTRSALGAVLLLLGAAYALRRRS